MDLLSLEFNQWMRRSSLKDDFNYHGFVKENYGIDYCGGTYEVINEQKYMWFILEKIK